MKVRLSAPTRFGFILIAAFWMLIAAPVSVAAAPYAAMVVDARSGEVLHARNADTRLHPASLTKMMTLYIAFEAVKNGEISLDTRVRISTHAASEPPSKLGLKAGQSIALRYLIRAAAVKSANDAATAIGEAISGSEAAFARRMNRTAKALGMTNTTFRNAHGLTESGHLSTARDMTTLGRHLLYDYPQYYNLFSRRSTHAGIKEVSNTNRRLLDAYRGADGIKTGYTRAAGFNLVASAERGNERIIATVFGGRSTATRNAKVAELLDLGFRRAPSQVAFRKPPLPDYTGTGSSDGGKRVRVASVVKQSPRPKLRPNGEIAVAKATQLTTATEIEDDIRQALKEAQKVKPAEDGSLVLASKVEDETAEEIASSEPEVVTRLSTSGGRHWGINVGRYASRYAAEKVLLKTALSEMATLDGALRKVVQTPRGFDANFMGLNRETAELACRRLQARHVNCFMLGPPS
ncbi:D-alanyl-D-alanine carboxypeptidase family protein [Shimia biformata]|uniref:D-alanyl-D-alanine carboxypeptidase family protein n=1 Tax=Shimia biformata TaxID=1294299 RepID=UPI00195207D9|nr:D-alanyl-D-alanine carboxypeptidase family protein [Shimia biformata]